MTTEQAHDPMTEAEVHAFATKTRAWWEQLTAREQALVRHAVGSAGAEGEDVQGYGEVESALLALLIYGDGLPLLRLGVDLYWSMQTPPAPSGPGGSGGSSGSRTSLN